MLKDVLQCTVTRSNQRLYLTVLEICFVKGEMEGWQAMLSPDSFNMTCD